eukprot:scaffold11285_cov20-Tisochrysis_lutea.AAC.2
MLAVACVRVAKRLHERYMSTAVLLRSACVLHKLCTLVASDGPTAPWEVHVWWTACSGASDQGKDLQVGLCCSPLGCPDSSVLLCGMVSHQGIPLWLRKGGIGSGYRCCPPAWTPSSGCQSKDTRTSRRFVWSASWRCVHLSVQNLFS